MNLSVSLYSMHTLLVSGEMSVCDVIEFFHQHGVEYVELLDIYLPTDTDKATALETIARLGMKVSSYSITNEFVLVTDDERKTQIQYLIDSCNTAKYFGTSTIRVFAGNIVPESLDDGKTFEACESLIVDSFRQCVGHAEKHSITYCLENHGMLAGKASQVRSILDAVGSPALKITADTGNFKLVGDDSYAAVKSLLPDIGFMHFKDIKRTEDGVWAGLDGNNYSGTILGEGDVDLAGIAVLLRDYGYSGCVSIEYEAQEVDCAKAVAASIAYVQGIM